MEAFKILRSPVTGEALFSEAEQLSSSAGESFPRQERLINFLPEGKESNKPTDLAASFRWNHSTRLENDAGFQSHQFEDFCKRYSFEGEDGFTKFLANTHTILEVGAGEGRLVDWFLKYSSAIVYALELSNSVYYLQEKYKDEPRVIVLKADALNPPFAQNSLDLISADQCIHHTDYPGEIFSNLSKCLKINGSSLLSVYAKKSEVREMMDSVVRDSIAQLPADRIHDIARGFTQIGKALHDMDVDVEVPENFDLLGELAGEKMSLQRFVYYAIFKCFYNDEFTLDKSTEFNHDWYCYPICNKTSLETARSWFESNGFEVDYVDSNLSNINIRGTLKD